MFLSSRQASVSSRSRLSFASLRCNDHPSPLIVLKYIISGCYSQRSLPWRRFTEILVVICRTQIATWREVAIIDRVLKHKTRNVRNKSNRFKDWVIKEGLTFLWTLDMAEKASTNKSRNAVITSNPDSVACGAVPSWSEGGSWDMELSIFHYQCDVGTWMNAASGQQSKDLDSWIENTTRVDEHETRNVATISDFFSFSGHNATRRVPFHQKKL